MATLFLALFGMRRAIRDGRLCDREGPRACRFRRRRPRGRRKLPRRRIGLQKPLQIPSPRRRGLRHFTTQDLIAKLLVLPIPNPVVVFRKETNAIFPVVAITLSYDYFNKKI